MKKKLLLRIDKRFLNDIQVDNDKKMNFNRNFEALLEFIGRQPEYNTARTHKSIDNKYIIMNNAYCIIKKRTDQLLRISSIKEWRKLKTSNKEIYSIRTTFEKYNKELNQNEQYIKIPYKTYFIFKAIVIIINEIKGRNTELPKEIEEFAGQTYRTLFYHKHIEAYDAQSYRIENERPTDLQSDYLHQAKLELHNDFYSDNSPFKKHFWE